VKVYEAIAEDMTHASDGMGREYTTEDSLGLFTSLTAAQKACEKHYGESLPPVATYESKGGKKVWHINPFCGKRWELYSGDRGWVMYRIRRRKVG